MDEEFLFFKLQSWLGYLTSAYTIIYIFELPIGEEFVVNTGTIACWT